MTDTSKSQATEWLLPVCALVVLGAIVLHQHNAYPKLSAFGLQDFSITCDGDARTYKLYSTNPVSSSRTRTVSNRSLGFIDGNGDIAYETRAFNKGLLDSDGVFSFDVQRDVRLIRGDRDSVLLGDETGFDITEELDRLTVRRQAVEPLQLDCSLNYRW